VTAMAIIILNGIIYGVGMWFIIFPFHNCFSTMVNALNKCSRHKTYYPREFDLFESVNVCGCDAFLSNAPFPFINSHQSSFLYISIYGRRIRPSGRVFGGIFYLL